ncbi:B12-binding domain-containing radical SAM protein [candidate division KSB1 bacterium]
MGYLAGEVKRNTNWNVKVYNAEFSPRVEKLDYSYLTKTGFNNYLNNLNNLSGEIWNEIRTIILEWEPAVIGISAKSQNFTSACNIAKLAKKIDKNIIVIVGGPHPSMVGEDVLKCPDIDIGVKGEGEITIVELLNALEAKRGLEDISGIVYRKEKEIFDNKPRDFISDLDKLSFPYEIAHEALIDYEQYPKTAFSFIFATRGCPYNCFFCGSRKIWSRKTRFRTVDNVVREINNLQKLGLKSIQFDDDTFGIRKDYIIDLCNALIEHCPGIKWSCELHVKLVNDDTISLMKRAGCFLIRIGIESGNNEILKSMKKNITIEEAYAACRIIKKYNIELLVFFIVGFPQETEESLNDTKKAMKKVKCDQISYSIFTPYPGTIAFEYCKEKNLIDGDFDVSLYNHQSPANNFCSNISRERFRTLVSAIEKEVDRYNNLRRIKRIFSINTIWRIRQLGLKKSFEKGLRIFMNK